MELADVRPLVERARVVGPGPFTTLDESVLAEILGDADPKSRRRAQKLTTAFGGMRGNILTFITNSGTTPGKRWVQRVQLLHLPKFLAAVRDGKKRPISAITQALKASDLRVVCNCPAFKWWGYAYIASQLTYKFGRAQEIFPGVRNPMLRGTVCKHLIRVLQVLPFHVPSLVHALKGAGALTP